MKKNILTLFIIFIFASLLSANNHVGENYFTDYSILDFSSAAGLSLQVLDPDITQGNDACIIPELQVNHWFSSGFGIQLAGGVLFAQNSDIGNTNYLFTAQLQYMGFTHTFSDSLATGVFVWLEGGQHGYTNSNNVFKTSYTAALGIGTEFLLAKHISIPLELGYLVDFATDTTPYICSNAGIRFRF